MRNENEIGHEIIRCAIEAQRTLGGPGLLENVYEEALAWEIDHAGMRVSRQVQTPIYYKGSLLGEPLYVDLLVEHKVAVECKATTHYDSTFEAHTLTYLRLTGLKLGIVINFGEPMVRDGIYLVVNDQ